MSAMPPSLTIARQAARLIAAKKISPVELTKALLARIKAVDPKINAFLAITEKEALAAARTAERAVMAGQRHPCSASRSLTRTSTRPRNPDHGAFRILQTNIPKHDAETVRRLREAGTVMLGKLATHEFAIGGPRSTCPGRRPATPGTPGASPAAPARAPPRRWRQAWHSARWAPTPAARSACPPPSAASPG